MHLRLIPAFRALVVLPSADVSRRGFRFQNNTWVARNDRNTLEPVPKHFRYQALDCQTHAGMLTGQRCQRTSGPTNGVSAVSLDMRQGAELLVHHLADQRHAEAKLPGGPLPPATGRQRDLCRPGEVCSRPDWPAALPRTSESGWVRSGMYALDKSCSTSGVSSNTWDGRVVPGR